MRFASSSKVSSSAGFTNGRGCGETASAVDAGTEIGVDVLSIPMDLGAEAECASGRNTSE